MEELPCETCIILALCVTNRSKFGCYNDVYHYSFKCKQLRDFLRGETIIKTTSFYDSRRLTTAVDFFIKLKRDINK